MCSLKNDRFANEVVIEVVEESNKDGLIPEGVYFLEKNEFTYLYRKVFV